MCEPSRQQTQTSGESTSFAEGSRARTLAKLAQSVGLPDSEADYGAKCTESLTYFDLASRSWRTSQRCLIEGMSRFSETWPRAGLMVNGKCYRRVPSVRHTHGKGCSTFSTLTVVSCEHPGRRKIKPHQQSCISAELASRDGWTAGGQLNPNHAAWFMGFPQSWTDLGHTATPSSHKSPSGSAGA